MKTNHVLKFVAGIIALAFAAVSYAASEDTAFVTALQGRVMGIGRQVAAFTKLREGETLTVSSGASVQLVYFESGRQETWSGGSEFKVGAKQSDGLKGAPASVKMLSPVLARQLQKTPEGAGNTRVGMVRLRTVDAIKMREITGNYNEFKKDQAPGDHAAEIYLLNELANMRGYDEMDKFIADMRTQYPNDASVASIADSYGKIAAEGRAAMTSAKN